MHTLTGEFNRGRSSGPRSPLFLLNFLLFQRIFSKMNTYLYSFVQVTRPSLSGFTPVTLMFDLRSTDILNRTLLAVSAGKLAAEKASE